MASVCESYGTSVVAFQIPNNRRLTPVLGTSAPKGGSL